MQEWIEILQKVIHFFRPSSSPSPAASPAKVTTLEGWLTKEGGRNKSWKPRWFVLKFISLLISWTALALALNESPCRDSSLTYYANSGDSLDPTLSKGFISLEEAHVQILEDHKFSFCFAVGTANRVYFLLARDREDLEKWTSAISSHIKRSFLPDEKSHDRHSDIISKYQTKAMEKVEDFSLLNPLHFSQSLNLSYP